MAEKQLAVLPLFAAYSAWSRAGESDIFCTLHIRLVFISSWIIGQNSLFCK
jgi:hypothetical protein